MTKSLNAASVGVGIGQCLRQTWRRLSKRSSTKLDAKVSTMNKLGKKPRCMRCVLTDRRALITPKDYDESLRYVRSVLAPKLDNVRSFGQTAK
jgi:hypothetical protein